MIEHVLAVAIGEFGRELIRALSPAWGRCELDPDGIDSVLGDDPPDLVVAGAWRPDFPLLSALDRACADKGVVLLPVVLEPPVLRLGPFCGAGPNCYECFARRVVQHDPDSPLLLALYRHYAADADAAVRGHIPVHVAAGAAMVKSLVRQYPSDRVSRTVLSWNLHTAALHRDTVLPVHGCPRCFGPSTGPGPAGPNRGGT